MSFIGNQSHELVTDSVREVAVNYGSAAIVHGCVVARDISQTDSDAKVQARKRANGVAVVSRTNVVNGQIGLADSLMADVIPGPGNGRMQTKGLFAGARVYVPASVTLPEGTLLVLGTEWDSSNNQVNFGRTVTTLQAGVLEALRYPQGDLAATPTYSPFRPANPFAILRQALTGGSSAGIQTALVEIIHRGTAPFHASFTIETVAAGNFPVLRCMGPLVVSSVMANMRVQGTANSTEVDVKIAPVLATADPLSVFQSSKTIVFPNDATDAIIVAGAEGDDDGTILAAGFGTSGRHGTLLAAESARIAPSNSTLIVVIGTPATNAAGLRVDIGGYYL